jgi:hypothetical protein
MMSTQIIPIKLLREIRNLRRDLEYMYRQYYRIEHPMVLKASQKLDRKINEYYRISKSHQMTKGR